MTETDQPTRDEAAKAFALELVALARKHGANHLKLDFDMTGETPDWRIRDRWDHGTIHLSWANGRHGARENISMQYESRVNLIEPALSQRGLE